MSNEDAIGFIRPHRRIGEKVQRSDLIADGCRAIVDDRDALERMTRQGTVLKVRNIFLFTDPRSRGKKGGWRKDLLSFMGRICKRGGIIKDVTTQLTTANPDHKFTLIDLAMRQLASNGRTVHLEKQRSGRRAMVFPKESENKIEKIWLNVRDYPFEQDAMTAIKKIEKDYSAARARREYGPRKYRQE